MADANSELLRELETLSQTLYQAHSGRRTASLVLPRSAIPDASAAAPRPVPVPDRSRESERSENRPRRRMSMSPWRSRPKQEDAGVAAYDDHSDRFRPPGKSRPEEEAVEEKKGIWNWKPIRALSHITMNRLSCLFSVEVIAVQGVPASMNGLRLSVAVRKKDTKEGAVQTMPTRVLQGAADFEETLFVRCHLYCSGGAGTGKPVKFEPRPFLVSVVAIDAPELDLGKGAVELSALVKESMDRSLEGARLRQWDRSFPLSGKARGGELLVKLGFQIMDDAGVGIYNQSDQSAKVSKSGKNSPAIARKQSKTSFSVTSPRTQMRAPPVPTVTSPSRRAQVDLDDIDDFRLDAPAPPPPSPPPPPPPRKVEPELKVEELDLPEFEVVDKGVEIQDAKKAELVEETKEMKEESVGLDDKSVSGDVVVKEVVFDDVHQKRLTELDSIAAQIMALESMMTEDAGANAAAKGAPGVNWNVLDAEEETVTREFLQLLEVDDAEEFRFDVPAAKLSADDDADQTKVFVPDLGRGLSTVVQTKDGGYLAAANPFDVEMLRKDVPKLAVQISKPFVLRDQTSAGGFEVFQRMAGMGCEELGAALLSLAAMDDLTGKTAEQIAFEGIASVIISGRNNKEVASSSAARSVAHLKDMAAALSFGRNERVRTGLWNASEGPVKADGLLSFALQRIEALAVEALRVQADMAEEDAPFDVFTLAGRGDPNPPLASAVPLEDWTQKGAGGRGGITVVVVIQLRDPLRRYETVGAPVVAVLQAETEAEGAYKVTGLHVGGMRVRSSAVAWDGEKQRLSAAQWLSACGLGKSGRKGRPGQGKAESDVLWSLTSRVVADMWLKPMRNPDVKFPRK